MENAGAVVSRRRGDGLGEVDLLKPAVLRGWANSWLYPDHWTAASFAASSGHSVINVRAFLEGDTLDSCSFAMDLATYVHYLETGEAEPLHAETAKLAASDGHDLSEFRYFCASIDLDLLEPERAKPVDLSVLPHLGPADPDREPIVQYWLGGQHSSIGLHRDGFFGYLVHLCGRKEVTLIAPDQRRFLYLPEWDGIYSPIDTFSHDLCLWPRFVHAKRDRVVLEPGDVLLIPKWWFHHVRALDEEAASINIWFDIEGLSPFSLYG